MAEIKLASIFWNLFAFINYRAGTVLPCTVSVVNLSDTPHEYLIKIRTFDRNGKQVADDTFTIDGSAWFALEEGERIDADGIIILNDSNVTLGMYLIEKVTQEEVDSIFTWLEGY